MAQSECNRIFTTLDCDLIEEGFHCKHVALSAQCPQRRCTHWHRQQAVAFDFPRRKLVKRNGVAVAATAIRLWRVGRDHAWERVFELEACEECRLRKASGSRDMAV